MKAMNREIKFRGKRVDNGEWVCGYYFLTPLTDESTGSKPEDGWYFLTGRPRHCISKNNAVYEIIPESVGQFTGRHSKDCKEIYEEDIAKVEDYIAVIKWDAETCRFVIDIPSENVVYDFDNFYGEDLEVIGNIYENPEFLEGASS